MPQNQCLDKGSLHVFFFIPSCQILMWAFFPPINAALCSVPKISLTRWDFCWLNFFYYSYSLLLFPPKAPRWGSGFPLPRVLSVLVSRLLLIFYFVSIFLTIPIAAPFSLAQQQRSWLAPLSVLSCFHFSIYVCLSSCSLCRKLYFPIRSTTGD